MEKIKLFFIVSNHFDLMWRRNADSPMLFDGKYFVSYSDLQQYYIEDNLKLSREFPFYAFQVESTAVLRNYMRSHPESAGELKALAAQNRLFVPFSGDNIIDSNLVGAESIIRNYLYGGKWLSENLGLHPKVCDRMDAFGNSAQLPQIMRLFGIKWITNLSYSTPQQNVYWQGLDKSTVLCLSARNMQHVGHWFKYRPCPACGGSKLSGGSSPCPACGGRGIDLAEMKLKFPGSFELDASALHSDQYPNIISVQSEEILPPRSVPLWASLHSDEYDIHFSDVENALADTALPLLEKLGSDGFEPDMSVTKSGELNPNNTGIYSSRIIIKQRLNYLQAKTASAEFLSLAASAAVGTPYPYGDFYDVWELLHFAMFHDAVTGTHVDSAYRELMSRLGEIDKMTGTLIENAVKHISVPDSKILTAVNTSGGRLCTAVNGTTVTLAPFSACEIECSGCSPLSEPLLPDTNGQYAIENEYYRITADSSGILEIFDLVNSCAVSASYGFRPNELVLEHDEGSPWSTLSSDRSRVSLSAYTRLVSASKTHNAQSLVFRIDGTGSCGYAEDSVVSDITVTLTHGIPRADFHLHVSWETYSQRLRIAFPTPIQGKHLYGIPAGVAERPQYEFNGSMDNGEYYWSASCGDWPALHFAGVSSDKISAVLFNKGTPSFRIEQNDSFQTMFITVLRSPVIPAYLHEPSSYSMTDWNGMSDHGIHDFDYALVSYGCAVHDSDCVRDAAAYNSEPYFFNGSVTLPPMPSVSGEAQVLGLKAAENGCGIVIHLAEQHGKNTVCRIDVPHRFACAQSCSLDESPLDTLAIRSGILSLPLKPFQIAAVHIF